MSHLMMGREHINGLEIGHHSPGPDTIAQLDWQIKLINCKYQNISITNDCFVRTKLNLFHGPTVDELWNMLGCWFVGKSATNF